MTEPNRQISSDTVLLITQNGLGNGPAELQIKLAATYFGLLDEYDLLPAAICFFTEGVRLVTSGSPVLDAFQSLEAKGVRLIICNTCLKYYDLTDNVQVGIIGGMTDIIEAQWQAEKVITL